MSAVVKARPCHSRTSPLNPNARAVPSAGKPNTITTRTHLSNLDRLLVRPSPLPLPLEPKKPPAEKSGDGEARASRDHQSVRGGLLNALNLSTFLPFTRKPAVDEMSPRSLAHLQRLLTLSPRVSPKGTLAAEWRRYHGEGGWKGLLDPLDPNLRRELLRYGDFVQAAYTAFHSMPAAAAEAPSHGQHRTLVLPDRSYSPTRSLFASSSLSIPPWALRQSAPRWLTQRSSFVGYVAVCDNEREVRRMGRRDIAVVLRGTATCPEWAENLRAGLVPLTDDDDHDALAPKVAKGFLSLYKTAGDHVPSLSNAVVEEVKRLVELYTGEELSITVIGHSLGASLAHLAADELSACLSTANNNTDHRPPPISVVSFGGPKTGNRAFVDRLQRERGVNVLRVVNAGDVVTRVPAPIAREGYAHAGAELKLHSRDSPCLRPDAGPACCHDLEAYLHLLDGFAGPGRPFRADASRGVARLLTYQRANVKRAYVERARVLGFEPATPTTATSHGAVAEKQYGYVASPT